MLIEVHPQSTVPIYEQIVSQVIFGVAAGGLVPGSLIPSVRDLAQRLLRVHAQRPAVLLYGVQALGSLFRESDMDWLDTAYAELEKAGFTAEAGRVAGA